jgi:hypothetical protein
MSLTTCPECAHEVSTTAAACPNCGHLFVPPVVRPPIQRNVVVSEIPRTREGFPPWAFIPLGVLGLLLVFLLFYFLRSDDNANSNINVNVAAQRIPANTRETTVRTDTPPNEVVIPPSSEPQQVIVPPSVPPSSSSQTTITTVPPETVAPDKGTVSLEAKIATKSGSIQPVKAEKFYLLDKDLQSILSDANINDETGQGLTTAFGLSVVYPDKYSETRKKALDAINKHVKYDVITDSSGKAQMKDVKPDSYYLFGITKTRNGYAIWSSPVSIRPGDNSLVLDPVRMTEITQ